ncbi:MAG TPA: 50S ribosomal protein L7/L12 [bacterium]|nr:50S ribosomal protein L7/L12 [bacterium]
MADVSKEQVLEFFDKMTLIELSGFVKEFEERFNVSAAAPVMMAGMMPGAGAAAAAEVEEQTEFSVILKEVGEKRIEVIKEVRAITQLGLKEAKEVVEKVPGPVKEGVSKQDAEEIKRKLEAVGAKVEIK